ncbi:MAG: hypothetical protein EOM26_07175 [Alphaproteobacteria bacterium]|nr:hypothetical protein [Alphaproteobacteria bacterium]
MSIWLLMKMLPPPAKSMVTVERRRLFVVGRVDGVVDKSVDCVRGGLDAPVFGVQRNLNHLNRLCLFVRLVFSAKALNQLIYFLDLTDSFVIR